MVACNEALLSRQPIFNMQPLDNSEVTSPEVRGEWEEVFLCEPQLEELGGMLSPVAMARESTKKESPLQGDIPRLILEQGEHILVKLLLGKNIKQWKNNDLLLFLYLSHIFEQHKLYGTLANLVQSSSNYSK